MSGYEKENTFPESHDLKNLCCDLEAREDQEEQKGYQN
jgi:hypothetical protein